jgi:hypothetical protein
MFNQPHDSAAKHLKVYGPLIMEFRGKPWQLEIQAVIVSSLLFSDMEIR